jgi:hypothetical protein
MSLSDDPNTQELISRILIRDQQGMEKFGITMRDLKKTPLQFIEEAIEENIDLLRYLIEAANRIKNNQIELEDYIPKEIKPKTIPLDAVIEDE